MTEHGHVPSDEELKELHGNEELRNLCRHLMVVKRAVNKDRHFDKDFIEQKLALTKLRLGNGRSMMHRHSGGVFGRRALFVACGIAAAALVLLVFQMFYSNDTMDERFAYSEIDNGIHDVILQSESGQQRIIPIAKSRHDSSARRIDVCNLILDEENVPHEKLAITIPYGKTYEIQLADGSVAYMSPNSRLLFPSKFVGSTRDVVLYGEAFFRVAKDPKHPFVVHGKEATTTVLGTVFCMSSYPGKPVTVTLLEGRVNVSSRQGNCNATINPGQQITMDEQQYSVANVDMEPYNMRLNGYFYFDEESVDYIIGCIAEWYNLDVEYRSLQVKEHKIRFIANQNDGIEGVIAQLNSIKMIYVTLRNGKLIVDECR